MGAPNPDRELTGDLSRIDVSPQPGPNSRRGRCRAAPAPQALMSSSEPWLDLDAEGGLLVSAVPLVVTD